MIPDSPAPSTHWGVRVGSRGQGEASLTHRTSVGSAGSHPGGLLFKEEPTQRAKQFVHIVQLLHFIPLWSCQWPRGLSRLRELLQLLNPRDSVSEWGARCGSKALAPVPRFGTWKKTQSSACPRRSCTLCSY